MKKRLLAMLLTLCMVLSLLPMTALAADGPVAKIGKKEYETLEEAIAEAQGSDTITLLADVTEDVTVNKSVTIDGASKTYTGKMTLNKVNVTIENVNFEKGNIYKNKKTGVGGNFTIKNCTFDGQDLNDYAVNLGGTSTIVIEGVTAKDYGYGFLQVPASNTSISVKDVDISNVNYGLKVDYSNGVTLENVNIDASVAGVLNSNYGKKTITIKDSEIRILGTWTRNNITETTYVFEGTNSIDQFILDTDNNPSTDTLKLAAGATLTAPEGANVTTDVIGYHVEYNDGTYQVVENAKVAQIGDAKYETLQAAITAAEDHSTVTLLTDIKVGADDIFKNSDERIVMFSVENKSITLDMNGKTISVDASNLSEDIFAAVYVADGANLTVTGDGGINIIGVKKGNTEYQNVYYMFWNRGTTGDLVIENGTYRANDLEDSMVYTNGNQTVTVKGGSWTLDTVGDRENGHPWIFNTQGQNERKIIVTGGTYNTDVSNQYWKYEVDIPDTHYAKDNSDGTFTIKKLPSASVGHGLQTIINESKPRASVTTTLNNVYAEESLVVKIFSGDTLLGTTSLRQYEDNDSTKPLYPASYEEITVNNVLSGVPSGSWETKWEDALNSQNLPSKIEVYADGKLVATYAKENNCFLNDEEKAEYLDLFVTVKYNTNGGSAVEDQEVIKGNTATEPANPTKSGYRLQGWYLDGEKYDFSTPVTDDITLTAKWKKKAAKPVEPQPPVHDCPSEKFIDVDQSLWYHEGIDYAIVNNLMNGVADNLFAPNGTTNRAMIVTILYRLEGSPAAEAPAFSDVAGDQWYTDAVGWAAANGIVTGYDEDTFGPLNPITREQMAAILYRYADSKGYDVSAGQNTNLLSFTDAETVSQYAIPAMQWAVGSDLINGVEGNALAPQGTASRAQVATILMRFCENVVK